MRHWSKCGSALGIATALTLAGAHLAVANERSIKVGVLGDMTGYASSTGGEGSIVAAQFAIDDVGKSINGKPIELISGDMQSRPDIAVSIARKWFDVENVDFIVDIPVSSVALAVQAVARDKHKMLLIAGGLTTDLTRAQCSPWTIQWADDTSALAQGAVRALVAQGMKRWFFVTADFAFGHALQRDATKVLEAAGGEVVGSVRAPMQTQDFASFLLEAQASSADVVAFANASVDTIASVKQAGEFGLQKTKKLAALLVYISDVHSIGLQDAQGLYATSGFYWDENEASRAFAKRFFAARNAMPTKEQANVYSGLMNYFHAIKETGSDDPDTVMKWLRGHKLDYFGAQTSLRADGRVMYDVGLYQVKAPTESKAPWDYYNKVATLPAEQAFLPLDTTLCKSAAAQ
jgi:branched-chain amino acid transport system substrate-binding protein